MPDTGGDSSKTTKETQLGGCHLQPPIFKLYIRFPYIYHNKYIFYLLTIS